MLKKIILFFLGFVMVIFGGERFDFYHQTQNKQENKINASNVRTAVNEKLNMKKIPQKYHQQVKKSSRGRVERLSYQMVFKGKKYNKSALVYLPANYETPPKKI